MPVLTAERHETTEASSLLSVMFCVSLPRAPLVLTLGAPCGGEVPVALLSAVLSSISAAVLSGCGKVLVLFVGAPLRGFGGLLLVGDWSVAV